MGAGLSEALLRGAGFDAILDIGKTRSKLLVLDGGGQVVASADHANTVLADGAYAALDTDGVALWLEQAFAELRQLKRQLSRIVVSAHGAAFAALDGETLALPVPDYEFEGFDERPADWTTQIGPFEETLSPNLPRGLNGATQLDWLERHGQADFLRFQLLPYAQFWSWWLSGVASSEVSSLGCHTHLWNPTAGAYSELARHRGWAARFAPLRRAWEVLGPVRPALAQRLGLPAGVRVHCGVHDSNACLASHLRTTPRMTLVTTGTWIVVMSPGAQDRALDPRLDLLGNVSVRQQRVPTGRFMGGRELQHLCAGADPSLANPADLARLLARGVMALPGFEAQGGPFRGRRGQVVDKQGPVDLLSLTPTERATLAALYTAQVTAWLFQRLGGTGPVVVEGPFAHNPVYTRVLATLLPRDGVQHSTDALEGTARGAWQLAHWTEPTLSIPPTQADQPLPGDAVVAVHARWLAHLGELAPTPVASEV